MRAIIAAAVLCVLSACTSAPSRAPVAQTASVAVQPQNALQTARAQNRHWLSAELIDGFPAALAPDYRPPERLAVLLPQSGPLAVAGNAIRDGLLAAYYAETRRKPVIRFYDSQGTAAGINSAMQRALADGAQMLIGGINKDEVAELAAAKLPVPVLALNRLETPQNRMLLNFSLSPEREGELMAERVLSKNLLLAGIFRQGNESDARAIAAFEARYSQGGGRVLWRANAPPLAMDENGERSVPALPEAMREAQALVLWLPGEAAKPLRAAIALSGMSALPIVASAEIANSRNSKTNAELSGIEYMPMPWLSAGSHAQNLQATQLMKLPSARGAGAALNAFGVDAWLVASRLPVWLQSPNTEIAGATGNLHLEPDGRIERRMDWRVYRPSVLPAAND